MSEMVERVARAIDNVRLFSRRNDLLDPPVIEICRYGVDDEDEIVVVEVYTWSSDEGAALRAEVSSARSRAAIEEMREPTEAMIVAGIIERHDSETPEAWKLATANIFTAMVDAALEPTP